MFHPSIAMNVWGVERMAKECIAPNLYLLTKANGTRYYIRDGKQIERSLGNAETISFREAKRNLARTMIGFVETEKHPKTKSLRFADALPMALNDITLISEDMLEQRRGLMQVWADTIKRHTL